MRSAQHLYFDRAAGDDLGAATQHRVDGGVLRDVSVIFPLFLMPQTGPSALRGYVTGFFYLAAWGPLYVVLHMFVMDRTIAAMNAASPGGMTMAGMEGSMRSALTPRRLRGS
jgi:hypothetical protein